MRKYDIYYKDSYKGFRIAQGILECNLNNWLAANNYRIVHEFQNGVSYFDISVVHI